MNEFAWRRQLRDLRQPLTPQRDLWSSISAAMDGHHDSDGATASSTHTANAVRPARAARWQFASGLAAALLLAGGIGWQLAQPTADTPVASTAATSATWSPADPRLRGAAIELGAARMELYLALNQAPQSAALRRLLTRTERQQAQLRALTHEAG